MSCKAFTNAIIYTMEGEVLTNAALIWENERIIAVGNDLKFPRGTEKIDAEGKTIIPGLIDAHTHIGILEEIYKTEGNDANEYSDPLTPQMRALDAVNPFDLAFKDALSGGVTAVMTGPGSSNVIGGLPLVMKTAGVELKKMVLTEQAGLKVSFGENPKRMFGKKMKQPVTRMAIAALLRQAFVDAGVYAQRRIEANAENKIFERKLGLEALADVLEKKMPLRAHAHRADDILTAIRIAEEFNVDIIIEHGTEGHKLIDVLKERGIPVIFGPTFSNRAKVEMAEIAWRSAALLNEGGVLIALTTDHSVTPIQYLPLCAAFAAKNGLDEMEALKAITINPAKILRLEKRIGSLAPGKDADFVVMTGHPLDWRTNIENVYVNGEKAYERKKLAYIEVKR